VYNDTAEWTPVTGCRAPSSAPINSRLRYSYRSTCDLGYVEKAKRLPIVINVDVVGRDVGIAQPDI
jgi:hypothetical protein